MNVMPILHLCCVKSKQFYLWLLPEHNSTGNPCHNLIKAMIRRGVRTSHTECSGPFVTATFWPRKNKGRKLLICLSVNLPGVKSKEACVQVNCREDNIFTSSC